jgi:hypothetical protein
MLPRLPGPITSLGRLNLVFHHDFKKNKLQKFINYFPNVSDLTLELHSVYEQDIENSSGVLHDLYIPKLQKLTLYKIECTGTELANLTARHSETLQNISLFWIAQPDGQSWHTILQMLLERKVARFSIEECLEGNEVCESIDETDRGAIMEALSGWNKGAALLALFGCIN